MFLLSSSLKIYILHHSCIPQSAETWEFCGEQNKHGPCLHGVHTPGQDRYNTSKHKSMHDYRLWLVVWDKDAKKNRRTPIIRLGDQKTSEEGV